MGPEFPHSLLRTSQERGDKFLKTLRFVGLGEVLGLRGSEISQIFGS